MGARLIHQRQGESCAAYFGRVVAERDRLRRVRAIWVPLVVVAVWVAALLLAGCSSSRLPDEYRTALTVTATESRRDLDTKKGRDIRRGYERTLGVVCAVLADDAAQGRGAWEWIVGLAGVTEHADVVAPEACK